MDEPQEQGAAQQVSKIKLCVVCGHLAFASHPVMVGHYDGDTFAGTEARLDQVLDGRLTERREMGLYPGPIGTSLIVLDSNARPPGAIVVGLGYPAELSIGALGRALRRGLLAFGAAKMDEARSLGETGDAEVPLQLSALVVGAGEGGVGWSGGVRALLSAARDAQDVLSRLPGAKSRFDAIEIVELFEDRAAATLRAISQALDGDPDSIGAFELAPTVKSTSGGRRSAPAGRDLTWWQPIQITMSGAARERTLSFTVSGGLARAEGRVVAANLDLVAPLVRRVTRGGASDDQPNSLGRTLFELLWPPSLKDQSADDRGRRLILDERSASFPWELLDDRRPWLSDGTKADPPAVRAGMVRQLVQRQFREGMVASRGAPKALIIGNPRAAPTGMPDLPQAVAEATSIAAALKAAGYDNVPLIGATAGPEPITRRLFTEAWEIIHISAHGVFEQLVPGPDGKKEKRTGIVLGGGVVLTASALGKIPASPGVVFVNCCYLGLGQDDLERRPQLAANIAVAFMSLGARCVIAAGWKVDDSLAAVFSETFYARMLGGDTFGAATLAARKATYDKARKAGLSDATWGAYQCYGDPDYRLRAPSDLRGTDDGESGFVAVSEAIDAAYRVYDDVNIGLERDLEALRPRLQAIEKAAQPWIGSAELRVALAEAWGELGDLGKAVDHYSEAVKGADTSFKAKAIEQLANLSLRDTVLKFRALSPDKRDLAATREAIRKQLARIEELTSLLGETRERLSLQGGAWKRLAQIDPASKGADADIAKMADCYARATEIGDPKKKFYPELMAINARICDSIRTGKPCGADVAEALRAQIDAEPAGNADFWELIHWADARVTEAILRSENPADELPSILAAYARAWRHVGSPVKLKSVIEQQEFYEDIFSSGAASTQVKRDSIRALAAKLRSALETEFLGNRRTPAERQSLIVRPQRIG